MLRESSKGLLAAVSAINQKSRKAYFEEKQALHEKMMKKAMKMPGVPAPKADPAAHSQAEDMAKKNMKEAVGGSEPRNEKEKKLAALRPPKDKITHGDVLHGRGVKKEEIDQEDSIVEGEGADKFDKMVQASKQTYEKKEKEKGTEKFDKRELAPGRTVYTRKSSTFKEEQDTPGNSYQHQCAIHVKHEQYGEGRPLFSQHAEPDEEGNIAWYDVMFEEGIVKNVPIAELTVLASESHMSHSKKKKKM